VENAALEPLIVTLRAQPSSRGDRKNSKFIVENHLELRIASNNSQDAFPVIEREVRLESQ
jgi:hypothetical protein